MGLLDFISKGKKNTNPVQQKPAPMQAAPAAPPAPLTPYDPVSGNMIGGNQPMQAPAQPPMPIPQPGQAPSSIQPYEPTPTMGGNMEPEFQTKDPNSLMSEYQNADKDNGAASTAAAPAQGASTDTLFGGDLSQLYPSQIENLNAAPGTPGAAPQADNAVSPAVAEPVDPMSPQGLSVQQPETTTTIQPDNTKVVTEKTADGLTITQGIPGDAAAVEIDPATQITTGIDNVTAETPNASQAITEQPAAEAPNPAQATEPQVTPEQPEGEAGQSEGQPAIKLDTSNLNIPDFSNLAGLGASVPASSTPPVGQSEKAPEETVAPATEVGTETPQQPEEVAAQPENAETPATPEVSTDTNLDAGVVAAPVPAVEAEPKSNSKDFVFKKIAFVNASNTDATLEPEVESMLNKLAAHKPDIIVDSKDGLGGKIIQTAQTNKLRSTGVYLKPFLGNAEENKGEANESAGFAIIYSNYLDRLKHLAKEARLFIVFTADNLHELAITSVVWSIAKVYKGSNKPIILFGDWQPKLDALKQNFGLTDEDVSMIKIVKTADECMQEISRLNDELKNKETPNVQKVVDRRVEGDEKDFMLY